MSAKSWSGIWFATMALLVASAAQAADAQAAVDFNRQIRPILSEACYQCHGPDVNKRKANLRLDMRAGLFQSSDGTAIVAAGKPEESELFVRVSASDPELRMPPPRNGAKLNADQIDLIRRWIAEGAPWKGHWSYLTPIRPAVPVVAHEPALDHDIDLFVRSRLQAEKLHPAPPADLRTLIRRLSFDLIGLPPTPAEVDRFLSDTAPDGYERAVDRLLSSPHFGERMAEFWLDLVRFADTTGYHGDNHVDLYLFRDYVIRAFNANMPFDRFTIEQLAGDLVPGATDETRIASGYNRLLQTTQEGGAQAREYVAKYSADRVRNVSTVWLGATVGCAECHDHKFDPYKTREFYGLASFFADIQETAVGVQEPTRFPSPAQSASLRPLEKDLTALKAIKTPSDTDKKKLAELENQRKALLDQMPSSLISTSVAPRTIRVLPRGNWLDESGPVVTPAVPAFLPALIVKERRPSRLDLARWLVARDNPLVARVMVNRLWKLMFGQGLVTTPDDFGSQGAWPSHPELLDWLACEFVDSGWDTKAILKRMAMSATYRQSSDGSEASQRIDHANRWLSHQNRYRFDAEFVRDGALSSSGLLSAEIGGPSVKPYQPQGYWVFLNFPRRDWQADGGENQYRRAVYTYWQRTFLHPSLLAFDASTREECVVARPRSNTPLQALVLLNDPTYVEAARALAARVIKEAGADPKARLDRAFQLTVSRPVRPREAAVLLGMLTRHFDQFAADPAAAKSLLGTGLSPAPTNIDPAELAAWTSVARVILNLHETITRS
jgi:mono/diheme cytochrome c family protein